MKPRIACNPQFLIMVFTVVGLFKWAKRKRKKKGGRK